MRLIDADVLIEEMKKTETEYENAMTCPSWWSAFNVISEQPTAYSVEKVVDELRQRSKEYNSGVRLHGKPEEMLTDEAIEIVIQGGVADDVCEWERDDMCDTVYKVCGGCFTSEYQKDFKYCPYCGKKIKIVGD